MVTNKHLSNPGKDPLCNQGKDPDQIWIVLVLNHRRSKRTGKNLKLVMLKGFNRTQWYFLKEIWRNGENIIKNINNCKKSWIKRYIWEEQCYSNVKRQIKSVILKTWKCRITLFAITLSGTKRLCSTVWDNSTNWQTGTSLTTYLWLFISPKAQKISNIKSFSNITNFMHNKKDWEKAAIFGL